MDTLLSQGVAARRLFLWPIVFLSLLNSSSRALPPPAEVQIVSAELPALAVVTSTHAGAVSALAARELAAMLETFTGKRFDIQAGDGTTGIAVGTPAEFPHLGAETRLDTHHLLRCDDALLLSHSNGLLLIGTTPAATRHAVWGFLDRLGYRRFFPNPKWEIIPRLPTLSVRLDVVDSPDYLNRRIWYGWGTWPENKAEYEEWCVRNRTVSAFQLNTGHAYDHILRLHAKEFAAHPEYRGLVGNERKSSKFCIANPDLRALIVRYAVSAFRENPTLQSLSLDPSDGGGWCECDACQVLGTPTDRALLLANEAAEAVRKELGRGFIGMYAYNYHSPPPTRLTVHPAVIISIATAFLKGGWTVNGLIEGWREKGAQLFGIREYYSVNTWDRDLPGAARGANLQYLAETIPRFHAQGARFLSSESSENWGPNGLGYYLAARMLWSTQEVSRLADRRQEFLTLCFGPARESMDRYYRLLDGSTRPPLSRDLLGRLYRATAEAMEKAADHPEIRARISDLILYTRYVELYRAYSAARGADRQAAFESLIRHAYRIRRSGMVHSYALYRDLANRDKSVTPPPGAKWNVPEPQNPWKNSDPFLEDEIRSLLETGIQNNPILNIEPAVFPGPLRPAIERLGLPPIPNTAWADPSWQSRGHQRLFVWVPSAPTTLVFSVSGGHFYSDRGPIRLAWRMADAEAPLRKENVPPDRNLHPFEVSAVTAGLYVLEFVDGMAATRLSWPEGIPVTFPTGMETRYDEGAGPRFFYVPLGTRVVGGYASGFTGAMKGPDQSSRYEWKGKDDYFAIPVPPGDDGKIWSFSGPLAKRAFHLLTVPPFFARTPAELLLPESVLERDGSLLTTLKDPAQ